jgi:hypothetical protein
VLWTCHSTPECVLKGSQLAPAQRERSDIQLAAASTEVAAALLIAWRAASALAALCNDGILLCLLLLSSCWAAVHFMQLVISAAGKNFCAGLDLSYLTDTFGSKMQPGSSSSSSCPARTRYAFRQDILQMQVGEGCCCHTAMVAYSPAAALISLRA